MKADIFCRNKFQIFKLVVIYFELKLFARQEGGMFEDIYKKMILASVACS